MINKKKASMKSIRPILISFLLMLFGFTGLDAQHAITTSGGNATGVNGNVSYSAGQVVFTLVNGLTGSAAHGVQQPYEISVVTSSKDVMDMHLSFSVYPIPATDYLTLRVDHPFDPMHRAMRVYLYDLTGKLLQDSEVAGHTTTISMNGLAPSIYFIRVMEGKNELSHFKIVKR